MVPDIYLKFANARLRASVARRMGISPIYAASCRTTGPVASPILRREIKTFPGRRALRPHASFWCGRHRAVRAPV
jgi:hypothetical protein